LKGTSGWLAVGGCTINEKNWANYAPWDIGGLAGKYFEIFK